MSGEYWQQLEEKDSREEHCVSLGSSQVHCYCFMPQNQDVHDDDDDDDDAQYK